jgi:hypothetical protein
LVVVGVVEVVVEVVEDLDTVGICNHAHTMGKPEHNNL